MDMTFLLRRLAIRSLASSSFLRRLATSEGFFAAKSYSVPALPKYLHQSNDRDAHIYEVSNSEVEKGSGPKHFHTRTLRLSSEQSITGKSKHVLLLLSDPRVLLLHLLDLDRGILLVLLSQTTTKET